MEELPAALLLLASDAPSPRGGVGAAAGADSDSVRCHGGTVAVVAGDKPDPPHPGTDRLLPPLDPLDRGISSDPLVLSGTSDQAVAHIVRAPADFALRSVLPPMLGQPCPARKNSPRSRQENLLGMKVQGGFAQKVRDLAAVEPNAQPGQPPKEVDTLIQLTRSPFG